jgi:GntR family transcriptional regulator / MocR family aminotransferase
MAHKISIKLDVFSTTPLYLQLASEVKRLIADGVLSAGEKLPSLRELSKQLQISVITVRQALQVLLDDDYVVSRHGSGNYVNDRYATASSGGAVEQVSFIIGSFRGHSYGLSPHLKWSMEAKALTAAFNDFPFHPWWDVEVKHDFRAYQPAAEFLQGPRWERAIMRSATGLMQPPVVQAPTNARLREAIAQWLNRTRTLNCSPDQIVLVSGAQQARDLIARAFVAAGTNVIVEEPGSITDLLAYATKGAHLHHIAQEADGIKVEEVESVEVASLCHLISAANFPTGVTLSVEKRKRLLKWARVNGAIIVEDAYGAGFSYESAMPEAMYAMSTTSQTAVIYVGSLSHFITPSMRLGFIVARTPLLEAIQQAKLFYDGENSILSEQVALNLFEDGFFDEHYLKLMNACRQRRKALLNALAAWPDGLVRYAPVNCGLQQCLWFRQDIDDLLVFERALQQGIGVIPMTPYFHKQTPRTGLSLNFARHSESEIADGMQRLLDVVLTCQNSLPQGVA